ncbi:hypothetical protein QBX67_28225, partial [Bacillus sp. LS15-K4]|nr:hypothetical protein [Bacillus sp. LS15-K4]
MVTMLHPVRAARALAVGVVIQQLHIVGKILGALRLRHHIDTPFLTNEAGHIGYDVAPSARRKGIGR